jgi:YesN/AraC family two-component response regulator
MKKISCAVIDDEPIARNILEDFVNQDERLSLQGNYKNAKDALKGITTQPVELVFLDINMPGLTGFQFLKAPVLKSNDQSSCCDIHNCLPGACHGRF